MNPEIDITSVRLITDRLILRPWTTADAPDLYAYARVNGVGQMAGWPPHRSLDESKTIVSLFIEGRNCFALEYAGKVIGSLGIEKYSEEDFPELAHLRGREIGYVLSKAYWGNGLIPEAVKAVTDYLFDAEGLDFILVAHFDWNSQSKRVIEKCGFSYCKTVDSKTRYSTAERCLAYIRRKC